MDADTGFEGDLVLMPAMERVNSLDGDLFKITAEGMDASDRGFVDTQGACVMIDDWFRQ